MKVPASIRRLHEDQSAVGHRLKSEVDRLLLGLKQSRWHYESRVKELDSFALKVESGRVADPRQLEDFFACTLVVPNALDVAVAEAMITTTFALTERRPARADRTHKRPEAFPFDDLRLYVSINNDPALPPDRAPNDLCGIDFEVQVKTFLQHAWTIATHALVYKTDEVNWSKERIAFQIKAMLEHAELSIQEAERLAESNALAKEDRVSAELRDSIGLVKAQWSADELPTDIRRLAENINDLRRALRVEIADLAALLTAGKATRGNTHPANLSPYSVIVQYLAESARDKLEEALTSARSRFKVLIPAEIELPPDLDKAACRNAIFLA